MHNKYYTSFELSLYKCRLIIYSNCVCTKKISEMHKNSSLQVQVPIQVCGVSASENFASPVVDVPESRFFPCAVKACKGQRVIGIFQKDIRIVDRGGPARVKIPCT